MWVRCCIILHNIILRIEAENFDQNWREELYEIWDTAEGAERRIRREAVQLGLDGESDGEGETELQRAQCQVLTNGQRFRHRVMNDLFNSPTSGAVCHT
jgi:hypothetical protein